MKIREFFNGFNFKSVVALILMLTVIISLARGQDCTICPGGQDVTLTSTFDPDATHSWTCTDGFTSNDVNPVITPEADVTCSCVVTDDNGCEETQSVEIDVCNCACNSPSCIASTYNSTTDCVVFSANGTPCSPVATDVWEWRNIAGGSWSTVPVDNDICGCQISEFVNSSPYVTYNAPNFRLRVSGLLNRCESCEGSDMRIAYVFNNAGYNSTVFPGCGSNEDWLSITPTNFINAGYVANAYVQYNTSWGVVINHYRFTYDGTGTSPSDVLVSIVSERTIYKDIETRRTITYTNGCPSTQCTATLDIPQQPPGDCTHFLAYVSSVNLGSPCSGPGFSATVLNGSAPTYQWTYNGSNISGQTASTLCLVGRPDGTYCVNITDGPCSASPCAVKQTACNLVVNITQSGTTLTAGLQGCGGSPSYQWARWNGTSWVNVGTNSSTYNTGGTGGEYRCTVTCTGPCTAFATYVYIPPCTAAVSITSGTTTLTGTVTGCAGASITYTWARWTGSAWTTVQTATTTSTTNVYSPTLTALYRLQIICNSCPAEAQVTWTAPNPCTGFSAALTGPTTTLCNGTTYTFGRIITGGTAPFTQVWTRNGINVGTGTTYAFTPATNGTYTFQVVVTDANGCTAVASRVLSSITCCGVLVDISPSNPTRCTNQSATFTATPTGGTSPYTYSWVSTSPTQSWGSGSTAVISFPTTGVRNITVQVTDANGCTATNNTTMTVNTCSDCVCTPTLTLNSSTCILTMGTTGSGCGSFSYQLQYSPTGTGWTNVASGTASNGFSAPHTPAANGLYRLVIFAAGCSNSETGLVSVNCVADCNCTPATLAISDCTLTWTNPCSGWQAVLQWFDGTNWVYADDVSPYILQQSGQYRVRYTKAGCTAVNSNVITKTIADCDAYDFGFNTDYNAQLYCVDYWFPRETGTINVGSTPNRVRFTTNKCSQNYLDPYAWTLTTSDGGSYSNSGNLTFNRDFATNGTFEVVYEIPGVAPVSGGDLEQVYKVYPNGTFPVQRLKVEVACNELDGSVVFSKNGCEAKFWFHFKLTGFINSTPVFNSATFTVNGQTFALPRTVVDPAPYVVWDFKTPLATPIVMDLEAIAGEYLPVELTVVVNTNQTLRIKGFILICDEACFVP